MFLRRYAERAGRSDLCVLRVCGSMLRRNVWNSLPTLGFTPKTAKQKLWAFEQTDKAFLEETKGLSISEMDEAGREWAEERVQARKELEEAVAKEEAAKKQE